MRKPLYSIVVPVYKSENSLIELYERIINTFSLIDGDYELILVEDNGGDNSWEIMRSLKGKDHKVKIIQLTKNYGQHNALICGFFHVSGDFVITLDDDLQTPPEEIPKLIHAILKTEYDVIYGIPEKRSHSLFRNIGSAIFRQFLTFTFKGLPRSAVISNFRIVRRKSIEHILKIPTTNPLVGLLLLNVTERIGSVIVHHHPRKYGSSTYTHLKLMHHFLNGFLYNSTLSLKGICYLGIITWISSILFGCCYLVLFLLGKVDISGWMTTIVLLLFFSGALLFSFGLLGEYLFRLIQEVSHTPTYIIRDKEI